MGDELQIGIRNTCNVQKDTASTEQPVVNKFDPKSIDVAKELLKNIESKENSIGNKVDVELEKLALQGTIYDFEHYDTDCNGELSVPEMNKAGKIAYWGVNESQDESGKVKRLDTDFVTYGYNAYSIFKYAQSKGLSIEYSQSKGLIID